MENIDRIVEQMPRAEFTENNSLLENFGREYEDVIFRKGAEAQCRLLAEQGYRKAKTKKQLEDFMHSNRWMLAPRSKRYQAHVLYEFLMEVRSDENSR